jgi:nicotinamidase/pyrazinamidase
MNLKSFLIICLAQCVPLAAMGSEAKQKTNLDFKDTAILVIDVQKCFIVGGSLAVKGTNKDYLAAVKKFLDNAKNKLGVPIYGSLDYHPKGHISFASSHSCEEAKDLNCDTATNKLKPFQLLTLKDGRKQMLWPDHCVQNDKQSSQSFLLAEDIRSYISNDHKIYKGTNINYDSYSAFRDDNKQATQANIILQKGFHIEENKRKEKHLIMLGIATDYCVAASAIDAHAEGWQVTVLDNLSRAVADDSKKIAIENMRKNGVIVNTEEVPTDLNKLREFILEVISNKKH